MIDTHATPNEDFVMNRFGYKETECKCNKCVKMCKNRPCWGTPEDIKQIIEAGFGNKLMLEAQGLGKGGKIKKICQIRVTNIYDEPLYAIAAYKDGEVKREGFDMTAQEFVKMFCDHMKCNPLDRVQRIEFEYL